MPYDDPDPTDPMTLHGVVHGPGPPPAAVHDMAECFVEEYARLGLDRMGILRMFMTKGYAGPNLALEMLGEEAICGLVEQVLERWGPRKGPPPAFRRTGPAEISLPVID